MSLDRISTGEGISGCSAILLLGSMFLDWFGTQNEGALQFISVGRNAWDALDFIPILLVVASGAALGVVAVKLTGERSKSRVWANAMVAILGTLSALLIGFRMVEPPTFGSFTEVWGTFVIEGTVQAPMYLGLLAAVGIALGGTVAAREEGEHAE